MINFFGFLKLLEDVAPAEDPTRKTIWLPAGTNPAEMQDASWGNYKDRLANPPPPAQSKTLFVRQVKIATKNPQLWTATQPIHVGNTNPPAAVPKP